jgi:hypothetical protein
MEEVIKFLTAMSKMSLAGFEANYHTFAMDEAANGVNEDLVEWSKSQDFKELKDLYDAKNWFRGSARAKELIQKYSGEV